MEIFGRTHSAFIRSWIDIIIATIITTALFMFMHGGVFEAEIVPVLNVLTMSLLMTVVLEYKHVSDRIRRECIVVRWYS